MHPALSKTLLSTPSLGFLLVNYWCSYDTDDYTLLSQCLDDFSASSSQKNCVKNYLERRYKENGKNTLVSLYLVPIQTKRIKVSYVSASYVSLFINNSPSVMMPILMKNLFFKFVLGTENRVQENFVSSVFQFCFQEQRSCENEKYIEN